MADRLERNTRTVTLITAASRVTGLARDAVLSRAFGVGPVMDAFALAFMVPNLFRRLFGEGALSAAFLPVYARLHRDDAPRSAAAATLMLAALMTFLALVTVAAEAVIGLAAVATSADHLVLRLMAVTMPYMPLVCVVALAGAMLQVHHRFGPTAAAPILLNGAIVVSAVAVPWLVPGVTAETHITAVAAAIVVAGVLQVGWSLLALRRAGVRFVRPDRTAAQPLREVARLAGPMILGLGVLQLNTFLDGLIASYPTLVGPTIMGIDYPLEVGALATLGYAQRLYEFPLGVFGIAVATAIFPLLATQVNEPERFSATVRRGLRLVVFIGLPASVGLILIALPATALILEGGDFSAEDTARVAFVVRGYAPAIWAYSMNHVFTRALYAIGDARGPVRVAVAMVGLNLLLNVTLIWTPLREAGLAWSTAFCAIVQAVILARLLARRTGPLVDGDVWRSWGRSALVCATMAAVVWPIVHTLSGDLERWRDAILPCAVSVVAGALVVVTGAGLLRMPELRWALGRASRG